jgi:hypothetical protein
VLERQAITDPGKLAQTHLGTDLTSRDLIAGATCRPQEIILL